MGNREGLDPCSEPSAAPICAHDLRDVSDASELGDGSATRGGWYLAYQEDRDGKISIEAVRPLRDDEMETYQAAVRLLSERQSDRSLQYVISNFEEVRTAVKTLAANSTSATNTRDAVGEASTVTGLGRLLTNWLNSFRMFDDHTKARLERRFGEASPEYAKYETVRASIFDASPSYRFMSKLRDYAQHVGRVPVQARVTSKEQTVRLNVFLSREQLLATFSKWGSQVRKDLFGGPEEIEIDDHVSGAMVGLLDFAQQMHLLDRSDVEEALEVVRKVTIHVSPGVSAAAPASL